MSLPPSVGTVRLRGMVVHPDTGVPIRSGRVVITYPYPVYATTDAMTVLPGQVTARITNGAWLTGPLLDPNDTDLTPQGYAYTLQIFSDEWNPAPRLVAIPPGSAGLTLDLTALGETTTAPAVTTYALVSQLAAYVAKGTLTAKGALLVATAAGVVAQLPAGSNGLVLTTDSSASTGLKWAVGGGGGGGLLSVNGETGPDVELSAADVGAAAEEHDHVTADILGLAAYVDGRAATLLAALVDAAPSTLDTLNELAAALGDDPNFAATITALLGGKASTASVTTLSGRVDTVEAALPGKLALSLIDAAGDLLVGSANDTATRLPKGGNGQLLGVTAGAVGWVDAPTGGDDLDEIALRYGCKAISMDPHDLSWTTPQYIELVVARHYQFWVPIPIGTTITGVRIPVQLQSPDGGALAFAIYQDDNSLLGQTGDVSTIFENPAIANTWVNVALTAAAAATGQGIWITALATIGGGPKLCFCNTSGSAELPGWLLNPATHKTAVRTEGVAAVPSTINPAAGIDYLDFLVGVY